MSAKTILIVDDSPMVCKLVGMTLEKLGYKVLGETNVEGAMARIRSGDIDLVLLDINMPEVAGLEICKSMKSNERTRDIPVVFLSTIDEVKLARHAEECGADGYINKNKGMNDLSKAVQGEVEKLIK